VTDWSLFQPVYLSMAYPLFTCENSYCFQRILAIAILSVRLSHGWISQKRCNIGSPNLHPRLPEDPSFRNHKAFP